MWGVRIDFPDLYDSKAAVEAHESQKLYEKLRVIQPRSHFKKGRIWGWILKIQGKLQDDFRSLLDVLRVFCGNFQV